MSSRWGIQPSSICLPAAGSCPAAAVQNVTAVSRPALPNLAANERALLHCSFCRRFRHRRLFFFFLAYQPRCLCRKPLPNRPTYLQRTSKMQSGISGKSSVHSASSRLRLTPRSIAGAVGAVQRAGRVGRATLASWPRYRESRSFPGRSLTPPSSSSSFGSKVDALVRPLLKDKEALYMVLRRTTRRRGWWR